MGRVPIETGKKKERMSFFGCVVAILGVFAVVAVSKSTSAADKPIAFDTNDPKFDPLFCFGAMERAVRGRENGYRSIFAVLMRALSGDLHRNDVFEAFIGMKYAEWRSTECSKQSVFDEGASHVSNHTVSSDRNPNSDATPDPKSENETSSLSKRDPVLEECSALADMYDATGGPNWYWQSGWSNRSVLLSSCCAAKGVTCDADAHVVELQIISNNMRGIIPGTIKALQRLRKLCVDLQTRCHITSE